MRVLIGLLRALTRTTSVFIIVVMLGLNALTLTVQPIHNLAGKVLELVDLEELPFPANSRLRDAQAERDQALRERDAARDEVRAARADRDRALRENRQATDALRAERRKIATVNTRSRAMLSRINSAARRNVSALPIEMVPGIGIAAAAVFTVMEVRDACGLAGDVANLRRNAGLEPEEGLVQSTCAYIGQIDDGDLNKLSVGECRAQVSDLRSLEQDNAARELEGFCNCRAAAHPDIVCGLTAVAD